VIDLSLEAAITSAHHCGVRGATQEKITELQQFGQGSHTFPTVKVDDVTLIPE
jgi:hypothetical protein